MSARFVRGVAKKSGSLGVNAHRTGLRAPSVRKLQDASWIHGNHSSENPWHASEATLQIALPDISVILNASILAE